MKGHTITTDAIAMKTVTPRRTSWTPQTLRMAWVMLLVLVWTSTAGADPDDREWYGWQTLTADAAAVGLIGIGVLVKRESKDAYKGLAGTGVATYLLAPPIVHGVHQRGGATAASFGMRIVLPTVALAATEGSDARTPIALGAFALPMIVDAAVLAHAGGASTRQRYTGGDIPEGTRVVTEPNWIEVGAGAGIFSAIYGLYIVQGVDCTEDARKFDRNRPCWPSFVPVVGPFYTAGALVIGASNYDGLYRDLVRPLAYVLSVGHAALGAAQIGTAVLAVHGFTSPNRFLVPAGDARTLVRVSPSIGPSFVGLTGTF